MDRSVGKDPLAQPANAAVSVQLHAFLACGVADMRLPTGSAQEHIADDVLKAAEPRALVTLQGGHRLEAVALRRRPKGCANITGCADDFKHHGQWYLWGHAAPLPLKNLRLARLPHRPSDRGWLPSLAALRPEH
jgi:hypothetical protein